MTKLFAIALGAACCAAPAQAAVNTYDISVRASDFGEDAEFPTVSLDLTLTLDDSKDADRSTEGLVIRDFSMGIDRFPLQYSYLASEDGLAIATLAPLGGCLTSSTFNSFCTLIPNIRTQADILGVRYFVADEDADAQRQAATYSVSVRKVGAVSAVPEPAAWALLLLGFGVTGMALRRRPGAAIANA